MLIIYYTLKEQLARMQSELRSLHCLCQAQQQMLATLVNTQVPSSSQNNSPTSTTQHQPTTLSRPPSINEFLTLSAELDEFLACPARPPPTPVPANHNQSDTAFCVPQLPLHRQRSHTTDHHSAPDYAPVTRVMSLPPSPKVARYTGSAERVTGASIDSLIATTVKSDVCTATTQQRESQSVDPFHCNVFAW